MASLAKVRANAGHRQKNKRKRDTDSHEAPSRNSKKSRVENSFNDSRNESAISTFNSTRDDGVNHQEARSRKHRVRTDSWVLSGAVGGRFLPLDPVFSRDEK
jgi:hypothetical protein